MEAEEREERGREALKPLILGLFIGQGLGFKGRKPESWPYTCMSRIPTRVLCQLVVS